MTYRLLPLLLLGVSPAPAAKPVTITLSSFSFTPSTLTIMHGEAYVLHLVNTSDGGHNLVARDFFRAAAVAPGDRAKVARGKLDLPGRASEDIAFVAPSAGVYEMHCSHFMHAQMGMKGRIVVL